MFGHGFSAAAAAPASTANAFRNFEKGGLMLPFFISSPENLADPTELESLPFRLAISLITARHAVNRVFFHDIVMNPFM